MSRNEDKLIKSTPRTLSAQQLQANRPLADKLNPPPIIINQNVTPAASAQAPRPERALASPTASKALFNTMENTEKAPDQPGTRVRYGTTLMSRQQSETNKSLSEKFGFKNTGDMLKGVFGGKPDAGVSNDKLGIRNVGGSVVQMFNGARGLDPDLAGPRPRTPDQEPGADLAQRMNSYYDKMFALADQATRDGVGSADGIRGLTKRLAARASVPMDIGLPSVSGFPMQTGATQQEDRAVIGEVQRDYSILERAEFRPLPKGSFARPELLPQRNYGI